MLLEIAPAVPEQLLLYLYELDRGTRQQTIPDFYSLCVIPTTVEVGDDFIKHIRGGDQRWQPLPQTAPMFLRGTMILIIRQLQRQHIARIQEHGIHRLYR